MTLLLQVAAFNAKIEAEHHRDEESSIKWTDTSSAPPVVAGEAVSCFVNQGSTLWYTAWSLLFFI